MSIHLLECAARLPLPPSTKLALMAFADSADQRTGIAYPGLEQVQVWASVAKSQASVLVSDLVERGLLQHHRRGSRGRRAEYVVFPNGCCQAHPVLADPDEEVSIPLDVIEPIAPAPPESLSTSAPGPPGAMAQPVESDPAHRVLNGDSTRKAPGGPDPFPNSKNYPPIPPAPDVARGCLACNGARPCRACGTTGRQLATAARRDRDDAERAAQRERDARDRRAVETARARGRPPDVDHVIRQTRQLLAANPGGTT